LLLLRLLCVQIGAKSTRKSSGSRREEEVKTAEAREGTQQKSEEEIGLSFSEIVLNWHSSLCCVLENEIFFHLQLIIHFCCLFQYFIAVVLLTMCFEILHKYRHFIPAMKHFFT
jgi:hypothetical protein